jgi:hypothetical protein
MSLDSYQHILDLARSLNGEEQQQLVAALTARAKQKAKRHSVLELRGLGKTLWNGVDAQDYVRRERESWNG